MRTDAARWMCTSIVGCLVFVGCKSHQTVYQWRTPPLGYDVDSLKLIEIAGPVAYTVNAYVGNNEAYVSVESYVRNTAVRLGKCEIYLLEPDPYFGPSGVPNMNSRLVVMSTDPLVVALMSYTDETKESLLEPYPLDLEWLKKGGAASSEEAKPEIAQRNVIDRWSKGLEFSREVSRADLQKIVMLDGCVIVHPEDLPVVLRSGGRSVSIDLVSSRVRATYVGSTERGN